MNQIPCYHFTKFTPSSTVQTFPLNSWLIILLNTYRLYLTLLSFSNIFTHVLVRYVNIFKDSFTSWLIILILIVQLWNKNSSFSFFFKFWLASYLLAYRLDLACYQIFSQSIPWWIPFKLLSKRSLQRNENSQELPLLNGLHDLKSTFD